MLNESDAGRIRIAWLAVAAGGLLAALSLLYEGRGKPLSPGSAAQVGEYAIAREQWQRAIQSVESDRGRLLADDERRAVLDRLIDEELLFQHVIDSGLVRDDPGLRKTLIAALIDATTAGGAIDEDAARALFERDPGYFAAQPRLHVVAARRVDATGELDPSALRAALADDKPLPRGFVHEALPDTAMPLSQLAQHLGGSAASALHRAAIGELIGPIRQGDTERFALLRERYIDAVRYEDVAPTVRTEWQRREAEAALAALIAELRSDAHIRYADDAQ